MKEEKKITPTPLVTWEGERGGGGRKGSGGEFNAQWRHKRPCVNS